MVENLSNDEINKIDKINQAQSDMSKGYADGSVGMIVSGLIWLTSAIVSFLFTDIQAIWTLLIGGIFIHPLGVLICKFMRLRGTHTKGNPLGNLAMEGTIFMIMCLPIVYALSLQHTEWFFQGMLLIIGGRYLTFASIYGNKLYWIVGAVLGIVAYLLFSLKVQVFGSAIAGSLIEIVFGLFMLNSFRNKSKSFITK
ncbi:MAG: DUF7010 family protein [Candidatus Saccharimonadaceae bacterium]